jgi:hypothetical protein
MEVAVILFALSILVIAASMGAMALGIALTGRLPSGSCGSALRECGWSIECEGCPNAKTRSAQPADAGVRS